MPGVVSFVILSAIACPCAPGTVGAAQQSDSAKLATVKREIGQWYEQNKKGFLAKNVDAIMALRTHDFHTASPEGGTRSRADMELYTRGLLNGIERWIGMTFDVDSLVLTGNEARAIVRQHLIRMALRPDGKVHHVETWATQREVWQKTADGWKLYRVDSVRDQKRLVDGQPG